jgi:hypothetical protein
MGLDFKKMESLQKKNKFLYGDKLGRSLTTHLC